MPALRRNERSPGTQRRSRTRETAGVTAVAEATKENFSDLIAEGTVLVDVWGPECVPCVALTPHVERLATERPDLRVAKL
ncbi:MAG: thioredoxin family protein, partial [Acidimicrobiales bacterium]